METRNTSLKQNSLWCESRTKHKTHKRAGGIRFSCARLPDPLCANGSLGIRIPSSGRTGAPQEDSEDTKISLKTCWCCDQLLKGGNMWVSFPHLFCSCTASTSPCGYLPATTSPSNLLLTVPEKNPEELPHGQWRNDRYIQRRFLLFVPFIRNWAELWSRRIYIPFKRLVN